MMILSDNSILARGGNGLLKFLENGAFDPAFQFQPTLPSPPKRLLVQDDGRITIAYDIPSPFGTRVSRFLPNGAPDPSFTPYDYLGARFNGHTLLPDGSVLIGDEAPANSTENRFMKLLPSGLVDTSFNQNGTGFLNVGPGKIRDIRVLLDGNMLIAGDFDKVNGEFRHRVARLSETGALDQTFQINIAPVGNYFSSFEEAFNINLQDDGKLLLSGRFNYVVNGVQKSHLVRLDQDGSIDPTFTLSVPLYEAFLVNDENGTNKALTRPDGKIIVGTSMTNLNGQIAPLLLNADGTRDTSFSPALFPGSNHIWVNDLAAQPEGKVVISGRHAHTDINPNLEYTYGYVARLNADGSLDPSFQLFQYQNFSLYRFSFQSGGQIITTARTESLSKVLRLNANGAQDNTFYTGSGANGKINSVTVLPDDKILVGGMFTSYDGQPRLNLALLNANGTLAENPGNVNKPVYGTSLDGLGRPLIGGEFTSITSGTQQANVTYLARFNNLSAPLRTLFDFDGDGKADNSVFRPAIGNWYLDQSTAGFMAASFGNSTDKITPADLDGDGKADMAVYRPENGTWYWLNSSNGAFNAVQFGASEDLPTPADYDGDGRADTSVFRPSNGTWYRLNSSDGSFFAAQFGVSEDRPTVGDFDGDGLADIAVWRPSNGAWYRLNSSNGQFVAVSFGLSDDLITPADFDGDGMTDIAVYRPSTGTWYSLNSSNSALVATQFGTAEDEPTAADYDGDGRADISVFRPSDGVWYRLNSGNGSFFAVQFGVNGDRPTPAAFRY
jgi:uncharacterized delta-60 repeat protein